MFDIDGQPIFMRTPSNRKILIGSSNSPSSLLAELGDQLPFWDRDIDVMIAPQANAAQLNGLLAVLDRYTVHQVMAVDVPGDTRAGRDWQAALSAKSLQPIDLQSVEIEPGVDLAFDGSSVLIGSPGGVIAVGPSERAHINLIVQKMNRLPATPQLILVLEPAFELDQFDDPRVLGLVGRGAVDLTSDMSGIAIRTAR